MMEMSIISNTKILLCLSVAAVFLATLCYHFAIKKRKRIRNSRDVDEPTREMFLSYLQLAQLSYCSSRLPRLSSSKIEVVTENDNISASPTDTFTVSGGVQYKVIATGMEDALWILKRVDDNKNMMIDMPQWFLLVRGTIMVCDIISDGRLMWAVAHDDNLAKFEQVIDKYASNVKTMLNECGAMPNGHIKLVGHSLGGCICEALLMVLRKDNNYTNLQAFALDTPGTPDAFRQKHSLSMNGKLDGLTVLNSVNNVVNTLTRPVASRFWVCGSGSNLAIQSVWEGITSILSGVIGMAGISERAVKHVLSSHKLTEMKKFVEDGDVRSADTVKWPLYSGRLSRAVYRMISGCRGSSSKDIPVPKDCARYNSQYKMPKNKKIEINNAIPTDLSLMESLKPYEVDDVEHFRNSMDPNRHMVIPLVGVTSVGKTSLLKAIMGIDPDDDILGEVSSATNTTMFPTVVRYPGTVQHEEENIELFIMDMPGVEGTQTADGTTPFLVKNAVEQLVTLKEVVQVCCLMMNDAVDDTTMRMFSQIREELGNRIMVVRNVKDYGDIQAAHKIAKNQLMQKVGWVGDDLPFIDVRLRRAPRSDVCQEEGVECMRQELLEFANMRYDDNKKLCEQKRKKTKKRVILLASGASLAGVGAGAAGVAASAAAAGEASVLWSAVPELYSAAATAATAAASSATVSAVAVPLVVVAAVGGGYIAAKRLMSGGDKKG